MTSHSPPRARSVPGFAGESHGLHTRGLLFTLMPKAANSATFRTQDRFGCSPRHFRELCRHQNDFSAFTGRRRPLWRLIEVLNAPEWPCCYVVYIHGSLAYVGQTENLKKRLAAHFSKRFLPAEGVTVKAKLPRRYGEWAMTELRLIKRLRPTLNTRGVENGR